MILSMFHHSISVFVSSVILPGFTYGKLLTTVSPSSNLPADVTISQEMTTGSP